MKYSTKSEFHFSYYPIPNSSEFIHVSLRKSFNCTAFKTWEACFAFLEWAVDNPTEFCSKTVLEVGSGCGLCGMMLKGIMEDCDIIMSDYCDEVTEYILGNIDRSNSFSDNAFYLIDHEVFERIGKPIPRVTTVDFCNFSRDHIKGLGADIVFATDVVMKSRC